VKGVEVKKALITGVTGQDGSYLAELLLERGYEVHGIRRRTSSFNTERIDHLLKDNLIPFTLHYADMTDSQTLSGLIGSLRPDEIYNLAAQSHVGVSFVNPLTTCDINALGTLRLLESIRQNDMLGSARFYQASTSELFGDVREIPQNELTPFYPRSPYGVSKLFSYWMVINYRESYNLFAANGILFNHESPRRGGTFVTQKIVKGLVAVKRGELQQLRLGNVDAKRDWGHAKDYVEAMWLMLQQDAPKDLVISSGEQRSVREFVDCVAKSLDMELSWEGADLDEVAFWSNSPSKMNEPIISVDPRYFRPAEVNTLLGDCSEARKTLGWSPKYSFYDLVEDMVNEELAR
jgi:GDPmannose 4,6-dehydratase